MVDFDMTGFIVYSVSIGSDKTFYLLKGVGIGHKPLWWRRQRKRKKNCGHVNQE